MIQLQNLLNNFDSIIGCISSNFEQQRGLYLVILYLHCYFRSSCNDQNAMKQHTVFYSFWDRNTVTVAESLNYCDNVD